MLFIAACVAPTPPLAAGPPIRAFPTPSQDPMMIDLFMGPMPSYGLSELPWLHTLELRAQLGPVNMSLEVCPIAVVEERTDCDAVFEPQTNSVSLLNLVLGDDDLLGASYSPRREPLSP